MASLAQIKDNVRKMIDMGAPETDIDGYIAEEGVTLDQVRNYKWTPEPSEVQLEKNYGPLLGSGEGAPSLVAPSAPPPEVSQAVKSLGSFGAAIESVPSGALFNFEDEIAAGIAAAPQAALDWYKGGDYSATGQRYTDVQSRINEAKEARRAQYPYSSLGGELAGGIAVPGFGAAKTGFTLGKVAAKPLTKIIATGTEGAISGGLSAAGDVQTGATLQERLQAGGKGAVVGGVTGGLLQGTANVGGRIVGGKTKLPTADVFRQEKNAFYDLSEKADMKIKPQALARLKENMRILAKDVDPDYEKATASKLKLIEKRFQNANSLREMDDLRQGLQREIDNVGGGDQDKLIDMKRALDSFLDNLKSGDYTGGAAAVPLMKDARIAVRKMKQMELLETIEQNADQFKTLSRDQAMISGIRQITKNPAKMRQFDKNVQDMLRDLGSSESLSAKLEKWGGLGAKSGGLSTIVEAAVLQGIPWYSIAAGGTGKVLQKTGEKIAGSKLKKVKEAIGGMQQPNAPNIGPLTIGAHPLVSGGRIVVNDPGGEGHGQIGQILNIGSSGVTVRMPDGSMKTLGKNLVQAIP